MPDKYTREQLAEAARASSSTDEAVRRLGRTPTPARRRHVRARMAAEGIDTAHHVPGGVRHTEAELRALVAASHSTAEVVRRLGIHPVGGNHTHIGRRIAELGLDTSHFVARPRRGPKTAVRERMLLGSPSDGRISGRRLRKELLRQGIPERCASCGTGPERAEIQHGR